MLRIKNYNKLFKNYSNLSIKLNFSEKLDNMRNIIEKLITNQATVDLSKLFDEGALISRMCCKVKKKFRGEKLFRRLKQVIMLLNFLLIGQKASNIRPRVETFWIVLEIVAPTYAINYIVKLFNFGFRIPFNHNCLPRVLGPNIL